MIRWMRIAVLMFVVFVQRMIKFVKFSGRMAAKLGGSILRPFHAGSDNRTGPTDPCGLVKLKECT